MASHWPFTLTKFSLFPSFKWSLWRPLSCQWQPTLLCPMTPALSLAGDHQISCASMVCSNNLGVSQEKATLDTHVLHYRQGPASLLACVCACACVSVCLHLSLWDKLYITGALVHQRDVLFFSSPQNQAFFLSCLGRIRWLHSFRNVWSKWWHAIHWVFKTRRIATLI